MVGYRTNGERWSQNISIAANLVTGATDATVVLPVGSLASVIVNSSNIIAGGTVFATVWIALTASPLPNFSQAVCRGWVSAFPSCAYPAPGWTSVNEALGNDSQILITSPAVGAGALLSMSGFTGHITSVHMQLVTDAVVANRFPRIRITAPLGQVMSTITSSVPCVASTTYDVNFVPSGEDVLIATTNLRVCYFDQAFGSLGQNIEALNLSAGDAITQVTMMVRMNPEIL